MIPTSNHPKRSGSKLNKAQKIDFERLIEYHQCNGRIRTIYLLHNIKARNAWAY